MNKTEQGHYEKNALKIQNFSTSLLSIFKNLIHNI